MANEELEQPATAAHATPKRARGGLMTIIKAAVLVLVIVVAEVVAALMIVPSAEETERLGQQLVAAASGESVDPQAAHHDDDSSHGKEAKVREVELGLYNITRYNPATNTTLAIDFELYGTVLASEAADFQHHFESNKARIREQVTMTLHGAQSSDLTDAGLGLIKRQILEKTNRVLGQPFLKEVLFSKFSFVER